MKQEVEREADLHIAAHVATSIYNYRLYSNTCLRSHPHSHNISTVGFVSVTRSVVHSVGLYDSVDMIKYSTTRGMALVNIDNESNAILARVVRPRRPRYRRFCLSVRLSARLSVTLASHA